jgi:glycine dehydrogenase subunit 1
VEALDEHPFFNEFVLRLPMDAGHVAGMLAAQGIACGLPLGRFYPEMANLLLVAVTEKRTKRDIGIFAETLEAALRP